MRSLKSISENMKSAATFCSIDSLCLLPDNHATCRGIFSLHSLETHFTCECL